MDERVIQFRVGVVVVAATTIAIILIMLFGASPKLFQPTYTLYIKFPEAPGVTADTPVRKSGVLIGRVSAVRLLDEGGVVLTLKIDRQFPLRTNEVCRISSGSLVTGDAVLEFVIAEPQAVQPQVLKDGDYLANGQVTSDPLKVLVNMEDEMSSTFSSIEGASYEIANAAAEVTRLAGSVNSVVSDNQDQIGRVMQRSEQALDRFHHAMISVDELVGDPELREKLRRSLDEFPEVIADARLTLAETRRTMEGFDQVSQRAVQNLENLEGLTRPLGEKGEELVASAERTLNNADEVLTQLVQFGQRLNNPEGSLGRFTADSELYERLNRSAGNIEDISRRLKPIVEDVRVFTDKIATDPRQLGVKGALDRRPSGTGTKFNLRREDEWR
jgi:phospholipid/cholesterol/gamma-HCH transport system substrate-binding protein